MKQSIKTSALIVFTLLLNNTSWASSVTITDTFIANTAATAGSVNTKFEETGVAINDNDSRIITNVADIGTNTANIQTNANNISSNDTDITNLQTLATDNATAITAAQTTADNAQGSATANASAISVLQGSATATTTSIDTNTSSISTNASGITSNTNRITVLENASNTGGSSTIVVNSTADNPLIIVDCASGDSLQAAIETAPLHGRVEITISGDCNDDIYLRRDGIVIQGNPSDGEDSITGNATGFSSAASEGYQYNGSVTNPVGLVQRQANTVSGLFGAFEARNRRFVLKDLTINAGLNAHAIRVGEHSRIRLINVVLNGHNYGMRMFDNSVARLSNTTVNTDGASGINSDGTSNCNNPFCGSGIFASVNSSVILKSGNTLNAAANAAESGYGLAAINGVGIALRGANNNIESLSIVSSDFEQTRFEQGGASNQITGDLHVCHNSSFIAQQITLGNNSSPSEIEVCAQSTMLLEPRSVNAISVTTSEIDINAASIFIVSEGEDTTFFPVAFTSLNGSNIFIEVDVQSSFVNENGGSIPADFEVSDNSHLSLDNDTEIAGNVEMYRSSSFFSEGGSNINDNLTISGFSTYEAVEHGTLVTPGSINQSVLGTVTCGNAEAFEYEGNSTSAKNDLCSNTD